MHAGGRYRIFVMLRFAGITREIQDKRGTRMRMVRRNTPCHAMSMLHSGNQYLGWYWQQHGVDVSVRMYASAHYTRRESA